MKTVRKREAERLEGSQKKYRPTSVKSRDELEERTTVLLFTKVGPIGRRIYIVDIMGGSCQRVNRIADDGWDREVEYAVVGSTLYKIGFDMEEEDDHLPRAVFFSKLSFGDNISCSEWQVGPSLLAGKPYPVLVTVNGKIYALAGFSFARYGESRFGSYWIDRPDPVFEVLDPLGNNKWEALPDPPFLHFYSGHGPRFQSHVVIGTTIYMQVTRNFTQVSAKLYSYDTELMKWNSHGSSAHHPSQITLALASSHEIILDNLRFAPWNLGSVVDGNLMYQCFLKNLYSEDQDEDKVFAVNLAARREYCHDLDDEELVSVPVQGLRSATLTFPFYHWTFGFICRLGKNRFCLFGMHHSMDRQLLRVCTFQVLEKYEGSSPEDPSGPLSLWAQNVVFEDHELDNETCWVLCKWCQVPTPRLSC